MELAARAYEAEERFGRVLPQEAQSRDRPIRPATCSSAAENAGIDGFSVVIKAEVVAEQAGVVEPGG